MGIRGKLGNKCSIVRDTSGTMELTAMVLYLCATVDYDVIRGHPCGVDLQCVCENLNVNEQLSIKQP